MNQYEERQQFARDRINAYQREDLAKQIFDMQLDKKNDGAGLNGSRLVFLDLEWHQLNKKQPVDQSKPEKDQFTRSNISQVCAISANYEIIFNEYVQYKPLAYEWNKLVESGFLSHSKQDDYRIAKTLEECFDLFCQTFPNGTLFVHYGSVDGAAIFRSLMADFDVDANENTIELCEEKKSARRAIAQRMIDREYRWANIATWIKQAQHKEMFTEVHNADMLTGTLGKLYDNIFHNSLLLAKDCNENIPPRVVSSDIARAEVDKFTTSFPQSLGSHRHIGLVPKRWLRVIDDAVEPGPKNAWPNFWNTKHLQPVWHSGHTDTVMTINVVVAIGIFKSFDQNEYTEQNKNISHIVLPEDSDERRRYKNAVGNKSVNLAERFFNDTMSSIIHKTAFFRMHQLAMSEEQSIEILRWFSQAKPVRTQSSKALRDKGTIFRTRVSKEYKPETPDDPKPSLVLRRSSRNRQETLRDPNIIVGARYERLMDEAEKQADNELGFTSLHDNQTTFMLDVTTSGGLPASQLAYTKRSGGSMTDKTKAIRKFLIADYADDDDELYTDLTQDMHPFSVNRILRFPNESPFNYGAKPWFTAVSVSNVTPRTEILHTRNCIIFSDPEDPSRIRNYAELNMFVYDFDLLTKNRMFVNAQFQFCKECKKYTQSTDAEDMAGERERQTNKNAPR